MAKPYQPRMTDPVSGRKLVKGQPVPTANPKPEPPGVPDPVSGEPMQKGQPVRAAYSGTLNDKVGIGIDAGARALAAGFKPANAGAKAGPKLQGVIRGNADAMQQGFDSVRQVGDRAKK